MWGCHSNDWSEELSALLKGCVLRHRDLEYEIKAAVEGKNCGWRADQNRLRRANARVLRAAGLEEEIWIRLQLEMMWPDMKS